MVYTISYDLNKPGQDYSELYEEIKSLGSWCHPVDSTWYVDTGHDDKSIVNRLKKVMDSSDALIVTKASAPSRWFGLSDEVSNWLKNHL